MHQSSARGVRSMRLFYASYCDRQYLWPYPNAISRHGESGAACPATTNPRSKPPPGTCHVSQTTLYGRTWCESHHSIGTRQLIARSGHAPETRRGEANTRLIEAVAEATSSGVGVEIAEVPLVGSPLTTYRGEREAALLATLEEPRRGAQPDVAPTTRSAKQAQPNRPKSAPSLRRTCCA